VDIYSVRLNGAGSLRTKFKNKGFVLKLPAPFKSHTIKKTKFKNKGFVLKLPAPFNPTL